MSYAECRLISANPGKRIFVLPDGRHLQITHSEDGPPTMTMGGISRPAPWLAPKIKMGLRVLCLSGGRLAMGHHGVPKNNTVFIVSDGLVLLGSATAKFPHPETSCQFSGEDLSKLAGITEVGENLVAAWYYHAHDIFTSDPPRRALMVLDTTAMKTKTHIIHLDTITDRCMTSTARVLGSVTIGGTAFAIVWYLDVFLIPRGGGATVRYSQEAWMSFSEEARRDPVGLVRVLWSTSAQGDQ